MIPVALAQSLPYEMAIAQPSFVSKPHIETPSTSKTLSFAAYRQSRQI